MHNPQQQPDILLYYPFNPTVLWGRRPVCRAHANLTRCPFHRWGWITNRSNSLHFIQANWWRDKFKRGWVSVLWCVVTRVWFVDENAARLLCRIINSVRAFAHECIALASFMQLRGAYWYHESEMDRSKYIPVKRICKRDVNIKNKKIKNVKK